MFSIDIDMKATLLAATFLIDYLHFEVWLNSSQSVFIFRILQADPTDAVQDGE